MHMSSKLPLDYLDRVHIDRVRPSLVSSTMIHMPSWDWQLRGIIYSQMIALKISNTFLKKVVHPTILVYWRSSPTFLGTHNFVLPTFHVCVHLLIYTTSRSSLTKPLDTISTFKYFHLPTLSLAASRRYSVDSVMSLAARKCSSISILMIQNYPPPR